MLRRCFSLCLLASLLCMCAACGKAKEEKAQVNERDEYEAQVYDYLISLQPDSLAIANAIKEAVDMFYEADSPYEDEAKLIPFLKFACEGEYVPSYVRIRAEYLLELVSKNMPGTKATNFRFVTREGEESALYDVEAPELMLIFYDPECSHCMETMQNITAWEELEQERQKGNVKILAIYTVGKDSVWNATKNQLPAGWLVGRDLSSIEDNELYDLKAMPTIYILDSTKTVLVKDY